jgi:hypothetical protein
LAKYGRLVRQSSPAITVGQHWMIMWPFDAKATGLPTTHRDTGAYIMWAGPPYAHVHVMGRAWQKEKKCACAKWRGRTL